MESDTGEQSQQIEEMTRGRGRGRGGCGYGGRGCTSCGVAGKTTTAPKKSSPVKQKVRCSRSSSGETEEQKASSLALSKQCKEKAQEIKDEDTPKKTIMKNRVHHHQFISSEI